MEGVPQQDVKELGTLKEQDISAIIGMCCETDFIQFSNVCTQFFLIADHKKTDPNCKKILNFVNLNTRSFQLPW